MIRTVARTLTGIANSASMPIINHRVKFSYSHKDERFLRFIDFDAKYLSQIPWIFQPLKPYIHFVRDQIYEFNQVANLPWWAIILITSILARVTIFPLIFIQMKKMSRIGPVWPIFAHIKEAWRDSSLAPIHKARICWQLYKKLATQEGFKLRSVFVYNLAYYPILISMIFSLRSLFSIDAVAQSSFLHLTNLAQIDPYYILPTLTVACYYWNFERFITPQNKHTIISRIRSLCQVLLILWYPFLCCWPSGIVIYMLSNAVISILQSSLTTSMWFQSKLNPKVMHYNYMLSTVEYDKSMSDSIIQAIKSGEESLKEKAIKETVLVAQTEAMIKKLNEEVESEDKQRTQDQNADGNSSESSQPALGQMRVSDNKQQKEKTYKAEDLLKRPKKKKSKK